MADLSGNENSNPVRLTGSNELHAVDVILEDGVNKLVTTTTVTVESLNGCQKESL